MIRHARKTFGTVDAAKRIRIEMHRLYSWEQHGIVRPTMRIFGTREFRRYSEEDIERAILVRLLVDNEGYTLKAAARKLIRN